MIQNKTDHVVDLVQFVKENPELVEWYNDMFDKCYTNDQLVKVAEEKNMTWKPHEEKVVYFGDHDGDYEYTAIGQVYDYSMRRGGSSKSFWWAFVRLNR